MKCPNCGHLTEVVDTRGRSAETVTRRRECLSCMYRFTTKEGVAFVGTTRADLKRRIERGIRHALEGL